MLTDFFSNPVFAGVSWSMVLGALLYLLRALPAHLGNLLAWQFTTSLVIYSEDSAFERVNTWLAHQEQVKKSRHLNMASFERYDGQDPLLVLTIGTGTHLLYYKRWPILVSRIQVDTKSVSWRRQEIIRIVTLGRSAERLRSLCAEFIEAGQKNQGATIDVRVYHDRWRFIGTRNKRSLDTVVLPAAQKESLIEDIEKFRRSKAKYHRLGIPYKRGYLFDGPPGTGKTSCAVAVASRFAMPIYILNLGSLSSDEQLVEAYLTVPDHALFLIEDVDAAQTKREDLPPDPEVDEENPERKPKKGVSLSAILNCIDGVLSKEGRLLVLTTNYPERLDPALLRPGRVDHRSTFTLMQEPELKEMCRRFLPEAEVPDFIQSLKPGEWTAAGLQEALLERTPVE